MSLKHLEKLRRYWACIVYATHRSATQKSESVAGNRSVRDDNLWHFYCLAGLSFTFLQSFVFGNTLDWTWL